MIKWLLLTSITGSLMTLFVTAFRKPLLHRLGGSGYYILCLLTAILFVVPIQLPITSPFATSEMMSRYADSRTAAEPTDIPAIAGKESDDTLATQSNPMERIESTASLFSMKHLEQWFTVIWFCGFAVILSRHMMSYLRYKRKVMNGICIDKAGKIDVIVSEHVHSPMLIGFFKPTIVIPSVEIKPADYRLVLLHEWHHYKQGDAWVKLFGVFVNAVHWFNPTAYLASARLQEACEYSCDEKLTRHMNTQEKKQYCEMILSFAARMAPALSSSLANHKSQLFRRFELIMERNAKRKKLRGTIMAASLLAVAVFASSIAFAGSPKTIVEYGGALKTYYNTHQTLEENVQDTLGLTNGTLTAIVKDMPFYIDQDGLKVDLFNRTKPHYQINREWRANDQQFGNAVSKVISVEGNEVTVVFSEQASGYKDDKIIEQMIRNQISFELDYQDKNQLYDHGAFIRQLLKQGVYFIHSVTEAKDFQFVERTLKNGDLVGSKPLTGYDQKNKAADIFNDRVEIPKNINGNQGKQLGSPFVIKQGETLAIDIKETTDTMPTLNWAIVNATTGELVNWTPNAQSGYRYIYKPGSQSIGHTFKVVFSGDGTDISSIEIFTF